MKNQLYLRVKKGSNKGRFEEKVMLIQELKDKKKRQVGSKAQRCGPEWCGS